MRPSSWLALCLCFLLSAGAAQTAGASYAATRSASPSPGARRRRLGQRQAAQTQGEAREGKKEARSRRGGRSWWGLPRGERGDEAAAARWVPKPAVGRGGRPGSQARARARGARAGGARGPRAPAGSGRGASRSLQAVLRSPWGQEMEPVISVAEWGMAETHFLYRFCPTILIFKENIHRPADVIQVRGCRLVSTWPSRFLSRQDTYG